MSCLQITAHQRCCNFTSICHLRSASSVQCAAQVQSFRTHETSTTLTACSSSYLGAKLPRIAKSLSIGGASGFRKSTPVCLFGGKGKSDNADEGSARKAFDKVMGNLRKEQSVEDVLRQQIQKQGYFDDGGNGGSGPGGGDGGGDGGESEDESLSGMFDELFQVILASIGFVFLYMLIIEGEEITTFAKDIIRFIFTGRKSIRLRRLVDDWVRFFRSLKLKEEDPYWLERAILTTPTWADTATFHFEKIGILNANDIPSSAVFMMLPRVRGWDFFALFSRNLQI